MTGPCQTAGDDGDGEALTTTAPDGNSDFSDALRFEAGV